MKKVGKNWALETGKTLSKLWLAIAILSLFAAGTEAATTSKSSFPSNGDSIQKKSGQTLAQTRTMAPNRAIDALVSEHLRASNEEDLQAFMDTFHPDAPGREELESMMQTIFDIYDLSFELNEMEVMEVSADEAQVMLSITTVKLQGPDFTDNITVTINTLRKQNGEWKFYAGNIQRFEAIDN